MSIDGLQHDRGSHPAAVGGQIRAKTAEGIRMRTVERAGRDVGVAECDDRHAARLKLGEQGERGLRDLLSVIEHDQAHVGQGPKRCRSGRSGLRSGHDGRGIACQLGGVVLAGASLVFGFFVAANELSCCDPLRSPQSEALQLARGHAVFDGAHHEVTQFGAETAQATHVGAERGRPGWGSTG